MNTKTGAKLLVECLESEGVKYIFGLPGEQTIPVMEELRKSSIQFITVRHEQGAAFMADIYSRVSGNTGVCIATLGPGATNLVTGIGNASLDHSSVVAITSQREVSDQHKHSHQFVDTNSVFEAVTKHTEEIKRVKTIPEQVRKAFEVAEREKQGATHLEFPADVSESTVDSNPLDSSENRVSPSGVQPQNIETALGIISNSDNPVILSGQGVISQNASSELASFAETSGIPVLTSFMGKGSISHRDDRFVGTIGFSTDDFGMKAMKEADTVVTIGYDYIEFHPENWNIGEDKDIIHIDTSPPEIDEFYGVEMTLIGNIARILEQFNNNTSTMFEDEYSEELREFYMNKLDEEYSESSKPPFKPQQIVSSVRSALEDDDIAIADVGSHKYWFSRRYPTYEPGSFLVSNGFASMGVAVPGCISASLYSDSNVVAVTGDGGFMMNMQEIETAKRIGVSPTIIVLDDGEYTAISMEQTNDYDELYGSSFENPNFVELAESFGVDGYRVTDSKQLTDTIEDAISSDRISIVSVPIDANESYKLDDSMR